MLPSPPTILVVDDEPALRLFAAELLQDLGYRAVLADSGRSAVQALLNDPDAISAVLLDMTMPGMKPEDTFRQLREIQPGLPVAILSGDLETEVRQRFGPHTISGYLPKPYTDMELEAFLSSLLAPPAPLRLVPLSKEDFSQSKQEFLAGCHLLAPKMEQVMTAGDFPALREMAHSLKGSGGCFGYPELTELGRTLENAAEASDMDSCRRQLLALTQFLQALP